MIPRFSCYDCSNAGIIFQIFYCYHFVIVLWTYLSWVSYSQHSAQMSFQTNNKMITRNYLQNNSNISLKWWLQQMTGISLIISRIPAFHFNNQNKNFNFNFQINWSITSAYCVFKQSRWVDPFQKCNTRQRWAS